MAPACTAAVERVSVPPGAMPPPLRSKGGDTVVEEASEGEYALETAVAEASNTSWLRSPSRST